MDRLAPALAPSRIALGIPEGAQAFAHQAAAWHMGILAKQAAVVGAAPAGCSVHAIGDHDANEDAAYLRYPVLDGPLVDQALVRWSAPLAQRATAWVAPVQRIDLVAAPSALPWGDERIAAFADAMLAHRGADSLAQQVARANQSVLTALGARPCSVTVATTSLMPTDLGRLLLERMLRDPRQCARTYNDALRGVPRAGKPLAERGERSELPLWIRGAEGVRVRASATSVKDALASGAPILPRALVASGMLRLLCSRFVHGTGGAAYEAVGDAWWRSWLGVDPGPYDIATATHLLPLPDAAATDGLARRSWEHPELLDASGRAFDERQRLLARLAALPRRSSERRAAYADLQAWLTATRSRFVLELDDLRASAPSPALRRARALANDRTWPAVLHDAGVVAGMFSGSGR